MENKRVQFIVCGVDYETQESTLERFPETLLGSKRNRQMLQKMGSDRIRLQCSTISFDAILFYYQSNGILTRPPSLSVADFEQVCIDFGIAENDICKMKERDGLILSEKITAFEFSSNPQEIVWKFLENPQSSRTAAIYAYAIYFAIFLSVLIGCFQTLPKLQKDPSLSIFKKGLSTLDIALNLFFLLELATRFLVSPRKLHFFLCGVNFIDLISILPFLILELHNAATNSSWAFLNVTRIFRVLRLLRVRRQSKRLQIAFNILSDCIIDVATMMLAVAISSLGYASILFYVEQTESADTQFQSIPDSLWWAVQTIIPLGYGDIVPRSISGKLAAGIVCVLAAFSFTVPVLFLGGKFLALYSKSVGMTLGNDFDNVNNEIR